MLEPFDEMFTYFDERGGSIGPGLALGVIHRGDVRIQYSGVLESNGSVAVDHSTLFPWGSTTLSLTAAALLQAVRGAGLSLESALVDVLPDWTRGKQCEALPLGSLLDSSTGWPTGTALDRIVGSLPLDQAAATVLGLPIGDLPGRPNSLTMAGAVVAGHLVERLTGLTFGTAVEQLVLAPLGMRDTAAWPSGLTSDQFAWGSSEAQAEGAALVPPALIPAKGMVGTFPDLLRWAQWLLGDARGERASGLEDLRRDLLRVRRPTPGLVTGWGLAWRHRTHRGVPFIEVDGRVGQTHYTVLELFPQLETAIVAMSNGRYGWRLLGEPRGWLLATLGLEETELQPLVDPGDLAGVYDGGDWTYHITRRLEGKLEGRDYGLDERKDGAAEDELWAWDSLYPVAGDQIGGFGAEMDFGRDDAGRVAWLRYGMTVLRRIADDAPWPGPDRRVVPIPAAKRALPQTSLWVEESVLFRLGLALTLVEGMSPVEVLTHLVPLPDHPLAPAEVVAAWTEDDHDEGEYRTLLTAGEFRGWTVAVEVNGYQATLQDNTAQLSSRGRAATFYSNVNGRAHLQLARDGALLRDLNPEDPVYGGSGEPLDDEGGLPFETHPLSSSVFLLEQFTGVAFTEADLHQLEGRIAVGLRH